MSNFEPVGFSELDLEFWGLPYREDNDNTVGDFLTQSSSLSADDDGLVVIAKIVGIGEWLNYGETVLLVWVIDGDAGGIPPMRQRQRDDGLATDSRQEKGHGSSLQSSQRRSSRTYY